MDIFSKGLSLFEIEYATLFLGWWATLMKVTYAFNFSQTEAHTDNLRRMRIFMKYLIPRSNIYLTHINTSFREQWTCAFFEEICAVCLTVLKIWTRLNLSRLITVNKTDKRTTVCSVVLMCPSSSYEERLKTMVLREEFFPLMEEVKSSVAVMTKGANGNVAHTSTKAFTTSSSHFTVI